MVDPSSIGLDAAPRDGLAWKHHDIVVQSARRIRHEVSTLAKKAAALGTAVVDSDHRGRCLPALTVSRLDKELQKEEENAVRFYEEYKAAAEGADKDQAFARLSCPNISFHESLWREATRRGRDVRSFFRSADVPLGTPGSHAKKNTGVVKIDIMADGGAEWVKILTANKKRLLHRMAAAGWDWDCEEDEDPGIPSLDENQATGIDPLDLTRGLVVAAEQSRVGTYSYQSPRIRVVFTRLREGEDRHIDHVIGMVRAMGTRRIPITVDFAPDSTVGEEEEESLQDICERMVPTNDTWATPRLNLDGTVLFNIGSDTSHFLPETFDDRMHIARFRDDISDERSNGPRLVTDLYPTIRGRQMVCTEESAQNFWSTVLDIGTPSEVERLDAILPLGSKPSDAPPTEERRQAAIRKLRELSAYPVPDDLVLPIMVVKTPTMDEVEKLVDAGELPRATLDIVSEERIKSLTRSTMWYSMVTQQAALTSNKSSMNIFNGLLGEGGFGQRKSHFVVLNYGRRLAAKPYPGQDDAKDQ